MEAHSRRGITVQSAYESLRYHNPRIHWGNFVWNNTIHPRTASQVWKILTGSAPTDDRIGRCGISLASRCCMCKENEETMDHLIWNCNFAAGIWDWNHEKFNFTRRMNLNEVINTGRGRSKVVKQLWNIAVMVTMSAIWRARNERFFDDKTVNIDIIKSRISDHITSSSVRIKGHMHNSMSDLLIFNSLGVGLRRIKDNFIFECKWVLSDLGEMKLSCDGAARGNPGPGGAGFVARKHDGVMVAAMTQGMGVCTNFMAEVIAIILSLEWATVNGHDRVWVCSDSKAAVVFIRDRVPWFALGRWNVVKSYFANLRFSHVYREANFAADFMARKGSYLQTGDTYAITERDQEMRLENPNIIYYRFS